MVDFRKWLPALVMIALFLGTGVMAYAQGPLTCSVSTGVPPLVRAEGEAELVGDIILRCTGGTPTAAGIPVPAVNLAVFLNAPITNKVYDGTNNATDSLLLIDEPQSTQELSCGPTNVPLSCGILGTGVGVVYTPPTANAWQGHLISSQYLSFPGIPIDPPGTIGTRTIRITNIRGNMTAVPVGGSGIPGQVFGYVSITSPSSISIPSNNQILGYVQKGLVFSLGKNPTFSNCNGYSIGGGWDADLIFTEGFPSAFKRRAVGNVTDSTASANGDRMFTPPSVIGPGGFWPDQPAPLPQDTPGAITFTESGYIPSGDGANNLDPTIGMADSGTRLLVRFGNIPANVTIYASTVERSAYITTGRPPFGASGPYLWSRVALVAGTDVDGSGDFAFAKPITPSGLTPGYQIVKVTSGMTLAYEVISDDPNVLETIDIPLIITFAASSGVTPGDALPTVNGSLAPVDIDPDLAGHTWLPRFKENGTPTDGFFTINPCETNILFPWVVSGDGFDTGVEVTNTSQDIFNTKPQSGNCRVNYFGVTTGGGPPPAAQPTTSPIDAGGVLRFVVSSGGTNGIVGTPGFLGYIIVQCDFQYAHGFAYITDGPIGQAHTADGYLGLILDPGGVYRATNNNAETLTH